MHHPYSEESHIRSWRRDAASRVATFRGCCQFATAANWTVLRTSRYILVIRRDSFEKKGEGTEGWIREEGGGGERKEYTVVDSLRLDSMIFYDFVGRCNGDDFCGG